MVHFWRHIISRWILNVVFLGGSLNMWIWKGCINWDPKFGCQLRQLRCHRCGTCGTWDLIRGEIQTVLVQFSPSLRPANFQENGSIIHQDIAVGLVLLILWECFSCTWAMKKKRINRCNKGVFLHQNKTVGGITLQPAFCRAISTNSLLKTLCLLVILGTFLELTLALASNMVTCNIAVATDVAWDFPPIYSICCFLTYFARLHFHRKEKSSEKIPSLGV